MGNTGSRVQISRTFLLVVLFIILMVTIGGFLADDYGQSTDEATNYLYGEKTFSHYSSEDFLQDPGEKYFHGTFYFMVWFRISKLFASIMQSWEEVDGRHFVNFLTFIFGSIGLFSIAKQLFNIKVAAIALLFFVSQPIFFGHAFINQKDVPFMSFFLVAIASGIAIFRKWDSMNGDRYIHMLGLRRGVKEILIGFGRNWHSRSFFKRWSLTAAIIFTLLFTIDLFTSTVLKPLSRRLIEEAYLGTSHPLFVSLFNFIAQDAYKTPLELYLQKFELAYFWSKIPLAILSVTLISLLISRMAHKQDKPLLEGAFRAIVALCVGASILGITIAVRVNGLFAGVLITAYLFVKFKKRFIVPILLYWIIAFFVLYIVWPTLWGDPIGRLWERLITSARFEAHMVLFEGKEISSHELPWYFLPKLMLYQFTEPVLVLSVFGFLLLIIRFFKDERADVVSVILLGVWFWIPFLTQIIFGVPIYGNFRQLLFIIPPLMIFAAIAFAKVLSSIKYDLIKAIFAAIIFAPAFLGLLRYHPYEYLYYNTLAGGGRVLKGSIYWIIGVHPIEKQLNS